MRISRSRTSALLSLFASPAFKETRSPVTLPTVILATTFFASHFAPDHLEEAAESYRATFRPSQWLARPHFMMAVGVCAAETDEEAVFLRSSQILAFARLRLGNPGKLPQPTHDLSEVPPQMLLEVGHVLGCSAVGSPATVRDRLAALIARFRPDEVMVTGMIHDHAKRLESHRIAAEVLKTLT